MLQSTALGPLWFVVNLWEMPTVANSATLTSSADDIKVESAVKYHLDVDLLPEYLDAIYKWAGDNNMQYCKDIPRPML